MKKNTQAPTVQMQKKKIKPSTNHARRGWNLNSGVNMHKAIKVLGHFM